MKYTAWAIRMDRDDNHEEGYMGVYYTNPSLKLEPGRDAITTMLFKTRKDARTLVMVYQRTKDMQWRPHLTVVRVQVLIAPSPQIVTRASGHRTRHGA